MQKLKVGDKVRVSRQIGHAGIPEKVTGTIEKFMNTVRINGEKTAMVKYDDGQDSYVHAISKIEKIND